MTDSKNSEASQVHMDGTRQSTSTVGKQDADYEASAVKRVSTRQRRASLDEYREMFMTVPKIIDRQPVFVSRDVRDRIDSVVRRLGERKMSVSGFLENLARNHLDMYADDLEQWKRL